MACFQELNAAVFVKDLSSLATNHQWQMLHRILFSRQAARGHRGQTFAPQIPSRSSPQK